MCAPHIEDHVSRFGVWTDVGPFWPKTDIMMPIQCLMLLTAYGLTQDFFFFSHLICVTEHVIAFGFACMFIYIYMENVSDIKKSRNYCHNLSNNKL